MFLRLSRVLVAIVALPIIALAPTYLASHLLNPTSTDDDVIAQVTTAIEPIQEGGETVMINLSISNRVPTHQSWYSADIIRNGVLIREDFVRPGDIISAGPADDPIFRHIPSDGDQCATILQLYEDEIDEQSPAWYLTYIQIVDEASGTLRKCSIPRSDSAE